MAVFWSFRGPKIQKFQKTPIFGPNRPKKSPFLIRNQKSKLYVLFALLRPIYVPICKEIEETGGEK
jgi:hypothetical protein